MYTLKTHEFDDKGRLTSRSQAMRLSHSGFGTVILQDGKFYYEDGELLTTLPTWLVNAFSIVPDEIAFDYGLSQSVMDAIRAKSKAKLKKSSPKKVVEPEYEET